MHHSWGRYPEDGESHTCTGPYTEKEAKEIAEARNKVHKLGNILSGESDREIGWFYKAEAVRLERDDPATYCQSKIRQMEYKVRENKRRGSADGSTFEMPSSKREATFNLGDKLKSALSAPVRLSR